MDNIHVEVMSDDLKPAPAKPIYASRLSPPAKGSTGDARAAAWRQQCIYPNGGGLVQYGLNRWRETGPLPGGHRKFWYLAKCLYDGGLDRASVEEHLRREKDTAHNPGEREAEIPAILEGFFG